jgi:PKD repeat protein
MKSITIKLSLLAALVSSQLYAAETTKRYIVITKPPVLKNADGISTAQVKQHSLQQLSTRHQLTPAQVLTEQGMLSVELSQAQLKALKQDPQVALVEEDPKRYLLAEETPYGITMVKALQVPDNMVSNRKVCILDTGYTLNHPDLINSGVTGDDGYGSNDTGNWYEDGNGHGTHVAGTISAVGGNNQGVVGVNRNGQLKLHIVKVFNNGGTWAYGSDLIAAINQCQAAGANVTSMSLGGSGQSVAERQAFEQTAAAGMLHIAAAGNAGNSTLSYPASYDAVVSVAAVDSAGNKASFSQYNNQVEIAAPGVNVNSTWNNGAYRSISGTSMATPHVSGVAALVWSHYPQCTNTQIRNALNKTATDKGTAGRDVNFGHGIINAKAAYDYLANGCDGGGNPPVNQAPVAKFTATVNGLSVSFTNQSSDDKAVVSSRWNFGDGKTSTQAAPTNTYAADGNYTVSLTVQDAEGLTHTSSQTVTVSAGNNQGCVGLTAWSASKVYLTGNQVSHQGVKYTAKWWTQNQNPQQNSSQWAVWRNDGKCQ